MSKDGRDNVTEERTNLELWLGRHIVFLLQEHGINRIELAALFRVGKNLVSFLDALEEGVIVCILIDASEERGSGDVVTRCGGLFVGVVLENLFSVLMRKTCYTTNRWLIEINIRAILI